jgi:hypothetical protein
VRTCATTAVKKGEEFMKSDEKFLGLLVLVSIGLLIYFDPQCNNACKKVIRSIGTSFLGS